MMFYRRTAAFFLALIVALLSISVAPATYHSVLAQSISPFTSNPVSVTARMALGTTEQITLTLQNTGGSDVTPQLYEAFAARTTAGLPVAEITNLAAVALPIQAQRVDPQLRAVTAASPNTPVDFLVFLADQADLRAAYTISDWNQRGQYVYQTLHDHAARTQAALRTFLDGRGVSYTPLWIVNALAVHGTATDVSALAERSDVAMQRANHLMTFSDEVSTGAALNQANNCLPDAANVCWNVVRIGADRVWNNFGVRGAGITVANIDGGVAYAHPALVNQYRGTKGGGVFDHNYNWYDPYRDTTSPTDSSYHGTHTMGSMVASGGASASEPAVGIAPGARWIAARACGSSTCAEMDLILAAQWMLAPTDLLGQNARPDLRPQIVSNSWSSGQGNDNFYAGYVTAWRAAGIFPVFAAGNGRISVKGCSSIQSPADYAQVVGVGALDNTNMLTSYSDIGPTLDGRLKPDITAPGSGIVSTMPSSIYGSLSGTSMATPQVAGSVALLWSANPSLIGDYDRTYQILTASASPISADSRFDDPVTYKLCHVATTPNNIYGYGRIDAYAAVAKASVDVPWLSLPAEGVSVIMAGASVSVTLTLDTRKVPGPGTYQARILVHDTDLSQTPLVVPLTLTVPTDPNDATVRGKVIRTSDGIPLAATVAVTNGATVTTDASGAYQLVLPSSPISYTLTANALSYAPKTARVSMGTGEIAALDFALEPDTPHLAASTNLLTTTVALGSPAHLTITLRNDGIKALDYIASLPLAWYGTWRSDQSDGPASAWIDPPSSATIIGLADDGISSSTGIGFGFPFFDQVYTDVVIGANGIVSFGPFDVTATKYMSGCLPVAETTHAAVIPLHADLDPSQPGAKVSYAHTDAGFLISWENVPIFSTTPTTTTPHLSFQTLLRPDGRVTMNYKQVDTLPTTMTASAGLQHNRTSGQSLGCGSTLEISNGRTIELRPQPDATFWAALPNPSGTIPSGQQVDLPVTLSWVNDVNPWPASVEILITSNDPARSTTTASARMTTVAAPFTWFIPMVAK